VFALPTRFLGTSDRTDRLRLNIYRRNTDCLVDAVLLAARLARYPRENPLIGFPAVSNRLTVARYAVVRAQPYLESPSRD
jgi:hypothetical protein